MQCPSVYLLANSFIPFNRSGFKFNRSLHRKFYTGRIPANKRHGLHCFLFKQLLVGFMLGDGWLEKHGKGVRLAISLTEKFKDVAQFYLVLLYGLGYTNKFELGLPLVRKNKTTKPYYQIKTFTFESLLPYFSLWYKQMGVRNIKQLPDKEQLYELLSPFTLAVWIMGDGSGMRDGGFKIASHSFTKEQNMVLCNILAERYNIKTTLVNEKGLYHIYVWKRSTHLLYVIVKPYLLPSCEYKFRFSLYLTYDAVDQLASKS
uniref:LAGLIDADG endonuclease n=1 Tax=Gonium pectorale TaxID=33097 RepID=M1V1S4_GONPE|nr:LAGLIDADG endonuclease [Gonium pectorale]BAM85931.1 LAGLIDADG endonuclease [Gonium pectorale]